MFVVSALALSELRASRRERNWEAIGTVVVIESQYRKTYS